MYSKLLVLPDSTRRVFLSYNGLSEEKNTGTMETFLFENKKQLFYSI